MTTGSAVGLLGVLALVPAFVAARKRRKGRNEAFATYYLFGLIALVIAIPAAIWVAKDERRRCPMCAERVRDEAIKCPHCHVTIGPDEQPSVLEGLQRP